MRSTPWNSLFFNSFITQFFLTYSSYTFYDDHTTSFVFAVLVGSHATIFAAVFRLAVNDLHRDDAIGVAHGIIVLGQFLSVLIPFHGGRWIAAQAAEQLAGLPDLDDTWS